MVMAKRQPDPFQTIDVQKLDNVAGGRASARASSLVGASQADPLMSMLTSIEQSVAAMSSQPSPMTQLLQMFEIMHGMNPGTTPATAARQSSAPLQASTRGAWLSKK